MILFNTFQRSYQMKLLLSFFAFVLSAQVHAQTWYPSEVGDFELSVETSDLKAGQANMETNQIVLHFRSSDGSAIETVELSPATVTPFMPSMGHGTPTRHNVTLDYMNNSSYALVENIYFIMPGMGHHGWVLRINAVINSLTAKFEVPIQVGG